MGVKSFVGRMFGGAENSAPSDSDCNATAFDAANAFYDHWNALPKNGLLPNLSDYLDRPMPDLQPGVAIVDILPGGQFNVRLVGTERVNLYGKDMTHQNPMAMFSEEAKKTVGMLAHHTVTQPCGNRGIQTIRTSSGNDRLGATMTLPLQVDDPDAKCFVHFQHLLEDLGFDEQAEQILRINEFEWIDLGAGIPD